MTINQTIDGVPRELRELLERLIDAYACHDNNPHCHLGSDQEAIDELRALLAAKPETVAGHHPACRAVDEYKPGECSHSCKTPSGAACPGDGVGPCKKCPEQGDTVGVSARWSDWSMVTLEIDGQHRTYVEACKHKQPQGEPVAWVECSPAWLNAGGDCATATRLCVGRNGISHLHPAHAEQPAPVAVVLPERRTQDGWQSLTSQDLGWNACLDEVTRLNTK